MSFKCEKVGYVRVSTMDQDPDNQCRELIKAGVVRDCIFIDKGVSGTKKPHERPAFSRLLSFINEHRETVKYLYVYEISRLGRTTLETINIIEEIEGLGVLVWSLSPNESFTHSEDKNIRQLLLMVLSWVAQRERDNLVERTKLGLDRARDEGKTLGRPRVDIDFAVVEQMRAAGDNWEDIAKHFNVPVMTLYRARKRRGI
jgi:DNA invertase Pin-like site-specific DNA recombinase